MKNFKKLSREELKNTFGGKKACTLTIQGSDGSWITRTGTCEISSNNGIGGTTGYCETGLGELPLSSNGGSSRC